VRNRTVVPAVTVPQETLEGRTRQAEQLLRSARLDPDPVARRSLLNAIRRLLPVSDGILDDLSEVIDQEPDLEVRECAWQVYEQVDLASGRDRPGTSRDAPRRRSAFISKRVEVENERQALKRDKRRQ
jgi:hypothetical protein